MLQGYHLITVTYRTASLEAIGQIIPATGDLENRLHEVKKQFGWEEFFCLNTCNRALFAFYDTRPLDDHALKTSLIATLMPSLSPEKVTHLSQYLHVFHGGDAVRHIFEVASAMDSLVLGEREIIRQFRAVYEQCSGWGLTGDHFRLLISQSIEVSKTVFNKTGIGEKALSVVALAYQAMKSKGLHPSQHIVLVGAGATNQLLAKFLLTDGFKKVTVFNRTLAKAQALAHLFEQGIALGLADLAHYQTAFDTMVVCTSSIHPIIDAPLYRHLIHGDTTTKTVVDLSVPNNVSAEVRASFNLHYIEIESLREVAAEHLAHREHARKRAESIITERLVSFRGIWHERQIERSLHPMVEEIKMVKKRTIDTVFADRIARLDANTQLLLTEMLDYMEKKCVAIPVKTIKEIVAKKSDPSNRVGRTAPVDTLNH